MRLIQQLWPFQTSSCPFKTEFKVITIGQIPREFSPIITNVIIYQIKMKQINSDNYFPVIIGGQRSHILFVAQCGTRLILSSF